MTTTTTSLPATHTAIFALYREPAGRLRLGVPAADAPTKLIAVPVEHERGEDPVGVVRLGLPECVTIDHRDGGAAVLQWDDVDAWIETDDVAGRYELRRASDGARTTVVRLAVIA